MKKWWTPKRKEDMALALALIIFILALALGRMKF